MKSFLSALFFCSCLLGCVGSVDLSKLNRDPRCLHPADIVYGNRKNNNEEVLVETRSFDERLFVQVFNKLEQPLGYRDVYGTELTNADLDEIGPYRSAVNTLSLHTVPWQLKREEFLRSPEKFPNRGTPYRALPRPAFCDTPNP